ncbi:MAG: VOC family protein [Myxococcales bacterium]|nr:VOC family protein [Myxococcales bacterium]
MIFVNLPVRDLKRSMDFFAKLGFQFDPKFTDEKAASMIVSEQAFVMLLRHDFFSTFTKRSICDTSTHTEALVGLMCASRAEVDEMVRRALEAGGTQPDPAQDHGFMYGCGFTDLDGHHWEAVWMDPAAAA